MKNTCEGCSDCLIPGIRWPSATNGDEVHDWVEKCDSCDLFKTDDEASLVLVTKFVEDGRTFRYGWAHPYGSSALQPFVDGIASP